MYLTIITLLQRKKSMIAFECIKQSKLFAKPFLCQLNFITWKLFERLKDVMVYVCVWLRQVKTSKANNSGGT